MTRIDSSSNIIIFCAYYFGNYDTLRKDFDQINRVVLLTNIFAKTYSINLVMIGLLIVKVFLKHNINFFILYIALFITSYIILV